MKQSDTRLPLCTSSISLWVLTSCGTAGLAQCKTYDAGGHGNSKHLLSTLYVQGVLLCVFHALSSLTLKTALSGRWFLTFSEGGGGSAELE